MAWSAPRTWVAGELVTAALGNQEWRDNPALLKTSISDDGLSWSGRLTYSATVTADTPIANLAQTWNAGGVTFTLLKANVTDTASAAGSLLLDLQVGGVSKFKVGKTGIVTIVDDVYIGATRKLYLDGGGNTYITESAADLMDFWTNGAHRVRIDASGRVGIGALGEAVVTDYALYVKTNAATWGQAILNNHATTPYGLTIDFGVATPNNSTELFARFSDATATRMRFYTNGGLGNVQANDVNLSDAGAKRGMRLVPEKGGALRRIRAIEFVMDQYKDSKRQKPDLMWYAQQLATVDRDFIDIWQHEEPEQVEVRDEAGNVVTPYQPYRPQLLGTRDHQVFMTNVLATQELAGIIDDLSARVAALEAA